MVTENNYKYLKPPTIQEIEAVVKKAGVSESQFERFNSIYQGAITHVRIGFRELPSQYWHIFFEAPNTSNKIANKPPVQTPKQRTKRINSPYLSRLTS